VRTALILLWVLLAAVPAVWGLGPHELLLLANQGEAESVRVAEAFAALRSVPPSNLLRLELPPGAVSANGQMEPEDVHRHILEPASRFLEERGLAGQVLAWVYATHFPVRVSTQPPTSLTGFTFVRGRHPGYQRVRRGSYRSALFAGPTGAEGASHYSQSFDTAKNWLGEAMPLPAMMLGYTGPNGNTLEETLAVLRRGAAADGTAPDGSVYFVRTRDVRTKPRAWQFERAARELRKWGIDAQVVDRFPVGAENVIGVMTGAAEAPVAGASYVPGALGDHLTSLAGVFDTKKQTKLTDWLRAGTVAASGTVTEPYAIWTKFPAARLFAHYVAGCTAIESYYQAVGCPLQLLIVGDPLAAPWKTAAAVALDGLPAGAWRGTVELAPRVTSDDGFRAARFLYLLDGRPIGEGNPFRWNTAAVKDGWHRLRVVAYSAGLVRQQTFRERPITVHNADGGEERR